ncbi:MAG: hypothetical protein R3Y06_10125 [Faecalibacterium sp.]
MKPKRKKIRPIKKLAIFLAVLLVGLLIAFFVLFFKESASYTPDANELASALVISNDYAALRSELGWYTLEEIAQNDTLSELYAVCLYWEDSVYYHACIDIGDTEQAALYLAACQQNAKNAGTLSFHIENIDAFFR